MALYTPFFEKAAKNIGNAVTANKVGKLAQNAYMGDEKALGDLMRYDPELAQQIKTQKMQESQVNLSAQATKQGMEQNAQKWAMENKDMLDGVMQGAAKFESFPEAQQYVASEIQRMNQSGIKIPPEFSAETMTPEHFQMIKQAYAQAGEGFTLAPGATRFDAAGNEVAANPATTATGSGNASAVSRVYDNGTTLMVLPNGTTQVQGPDGNVLEGEARTAALRAAREEEIEFAADKRGATSRTSAEEKRLQDTIDIGLDAAQGAATIRRSIDLLNEVETGGWNSAAIKAKQAFGIESANEGELASGLGKSVLSQLRSTFGAAFTEREGARLEGIEARMGANTETNKRLLQQALSLVERSANRAIEAAYETGDDRTAQSIEELLDFQLTSEAPASVSAPAVGGAPVTVNNQADFDALPPGAIYLEDGIQYRKP